MKKNDQKQQQPSSLGFALAAVFAVTVIMTARFWDRIPYVKDHRVKNSIKVEQSGYDFRTGVLAVKLYNPNWRDVKNVELGCNLIGASGSTIKSVNLTIYEKLDGGETIEGGEKVSASSIQVRNVECEVKDAIVLETIFGGLDPSGPIPENKIRSHRQRSQRDN